CQQNNEDPFTF
nr:immunoglobulin light chain junction region [Mus musculus]NSL99406.1 immunoglobulin light chain junction region [Mus musculus]NSM00595.1 immunoglobulin light chain junction region [Mus musculus]NSM00837.1 immunoglobulin light chain junction region [Mus musculus]NSM02300.1 immunoglobulin light chain junction region [Mus musculus]